MAESSPTEPIEEASVISPRLISPAALGVAILLVVSYFNNQTYTRNATIIYTLAGIIGVFAISHFWRPLRFGRAHAIYLVIYHALLAYTLIVVVPTTSYYLYAWVMFMYVAEFFYQAAGMAWSSVALLATMVYGMHYQHHVFNKKLVIELVSQFVIIVLVNRVMTGLAFGNRKERAIFNQRYLHSELEHERLVALINSMSEGVIATDEQGNIQNYNAAALDILDTNATLTNEQLGNYMPMVNSIDNPVDIMEVARKTKYIQRITDLSLALDDDEKIALDINISRIVRATPLGQQQGYTFMFRDITKQKSLDEEKDLFISEVSHELRTPITIAEGNTSMAVLLLGKQDMKIDEVKDAVEKAHDQVVFLADIVNDLSALSIAQRTDKPMDIDTFQVADVLKELEETYRPQAEKKGLYMKVEMAPSTPALTTSRLYFREIMQNLITNAIKYTQKGGITIKGQAIDKNNLIIGVEDTGQGIAKSEQGKVFQKFWRSEDPLTRSTGGTGLGLYITAKLAQRIGAQLKLESKIKEGSTFSIIVPVEAAKIIDEKNVAKNEVNSMF